MPKGNEQSQELAFQSINLVPREAKPRTRGLTYARDQGIGTKQTEALLEGVGEYIDILKLAGFGVRMQSKKALAEKVAVCAEYNVDVGLGGALLELALLQGGDSVTRFLGEVSEAGISHIEVCAEITIIPVDDLLELMDYVKSFGIKPIAEVGIAYGISEQEEIEVDVTRLLNTFKQFEEAGAWMLLLESEGITESVKPENRRWDIVSKVAGSFPLDRIMFEADDKDVYTHYIKNYGPEVNLFVDRRKIMSLEGTRRGGWGKHPVVNRVAAFTRSRNRK